MDKLLESIKLKYYEDNKRKVIDERIEKQLLDLIRELKKINWYIEVFLVQIFHQIFGVGFLMLEKKVNILRMMY